VTILISLILYIIYIVPPWSLPFNSFPTPLKAIARDFLVLFHMKSINHILSPQSPSFTLLLPTSPSTHTVPILQYWFSLLILKLMFKRESQCLPTVGLFNLFHCSPLPLYFPPLHFSTSFNTHPISSTFTFMLYDIADILSFSFPFPLSPSSLE
jgi:hypothetical protein